MYAMKERPIKGAKLTKADVSAVLGEDRAMHLDLVGTAEAAELLDVERARIGKWRRKGILLADGERVRFPDPVWVVTTCAWRDGTDTRDHTKLAATPLWWGDDIRSLKRTLDRNRPRD